MEIINPQAVHLNEVPRRHQDKEGELAIINKIITWKRTQENKNNSYDIDMDEEQVLQFVSLLWRGREVGIDFDTLTDIDCKPEWLDVEKLAKGQKFAREYYVSISSSEVVCLLMILSNDNVLRKLIYTGKSSEAFTSFKRYLSTGKRVRSWMTTDLFDKQSEGCKNLNIVNSMHRSFYKNLEKANEIEFEEATKMEMAKGNVCPFLHKDIDHLKFPVNFKDIPKDKLPMSQTEMLVTQFSFVGFLMLEPEKFGVDPTKNAEGLEGFVHLWRYIGYRLGTKDKFNLCSGSYKEIRAKLKLLMDFVVKPSLQTASPRWEHMTRSIVEGLQFYTDTFSYEAHLMFGLEILKLNFEHFYYSCSLKSRLEFQTMKLLNTYLLPLTWFRKLVTDLLLKKIDKVSQNMPSEKEFKKKME